MRNKPEEKRGVWRTEAREKKGSRQGDCTGEGSVKRVWHLRSHSMRRQIRGCEAGEGGWGLGVMDLVSYLSGMCPVSTEPCMLCGTE